MIGYSMMADKGVGPSRERDGEKHLSISTERQYARDDRRRMSPQAVAKIWRQLCGGSKRFLAALP